MLEGLVIFVVLWVLSRRKRGDGLIIGTLLVLYAVFRTVIEFFREPDVQLGFICGSVHDGAAADAAAGLRGRLAGSCGGRVIRARGAERAIKA